MTSEQLRRIREAIGMTGRAMARHLGYHEAHYYNLEAGRYPITKRAEKQVIDLAKRSVAEYGGQS